MMLSNGISTRLQRLQHHKSSPRAEGLSHMPEYSTLGHERQATFTRVPTKKGLAADLINKFNQLSAVSSKGSNNGERLSTIGRATLAAGQLPRKGVRQLFHRTENNTPPASDEKRERVDATVGDATIRQLFHRTENNTPPASDEKRERVDATVGDATIIQESRLHQTRDNAAAYDEDSIVVDVRDPQPHVLGEKGVASGGHDLSAAHGDGLSSAEDAQTACSPRSVFLSDSELDRALLEIQEFSRNMNISLADDM
ncbi:hypothetical protein COEREDRAFT_13973 [Coemansia reversa NRRL 1564]|uniref:Uncharacterized protein n=1 Tax=Coemansia reversa (strain ATCC 12441 / NRRL 1564) TaxID=763665 RepID=A0A2G5BHI1_COERN|nr:hypothetical protein COEREDRAFT_13973 [Coemansia reversa NRRL 1564]|eukprot:PIA18432.1 hypothetical protein COEREDRAFT_13973 [Coemansia reversa NRRL 1564]